MRIRMIDKFIYSYFKVINKEKKWKKISVLDFKQCAGRSKVGSDFRLGEGGGEFR